MLSRRKMKDGDAMKHTPITIAVASRKGGSGKSSITAALAVQAAKEGRPGGAARLGAAGIVDPLVGHARQAGQPTADPRGCRARGSAAEAFRAYLAPNGGRRG